MPILTHDLAALEDSLADGVSFSIRELPSEWTASLRDARLYEIENENDLATNIASEEFKSKRLCAVMHDEELEKTLKKYLQNNKVEHRGKRFKHTFLSTWIFKVVRKRYFGKATLCTAYYDSC